MGAQSGLDLQDLDVGLAGRLAVGNQALQFAPAFAAQRFVREVQS
jgi:hypothetical protein